MILVGFLTEYQRNELVGQLYDEDSYFNPIQDFNDNWIISQEEMDFCTKIEFFWIKELPLIEFIPKEQPFPPL